MQPTSRRYVRFLGPIGVLGFGLALFLLPGSRAWLGGMIMLFTQRSVQTLQGAINAAPFSFLKCASLSALQTCIRSLLPARFAWAPSWVLPLPLSAPWEAVDSGTEPRGCFFFPAVTYRSDGIGPGPSLPSGWPLVSLWPCWA